jgi:hypothetical protein
MCVANQDISLDNFQSPFRKDRVDRLGGGAAIYVKNDYHVVHRNDLEVLGVAWIRSMTFGSVDEIKSIHELEFSVK